MNKRKMKDITDRAKHFPPLEERPEQIETSEFPDYEEVDFSKYMNPPEAGD